MKREKYSAATDEAQVDMTPMLDIVFIMLIFFIVTTTFSNEIGLSPNRPPDTPNPPSESKALSVSINEAGQIEMGGRSVDIARVGANAQLFLAENNATSAAIRAHENTEHGLVVRVMDQLKIAGIGTVQVLVKND